MCHFTASVRVFGAGQVWGAAAGAGRAEGSRREHTGDDRGHAAAGGTGRAALAYPLPLSGSGSELRAPA